MWQCHQLLSGFLAKGHLLRVSRRSLMISMIIKWSRGLCTDLAFSLRLRGTSARRPSHEEAVRPVIASNGVPFLQIRSVGSHSTPGEEKEGKRKGWLHFSLNCIFSFKLLLTAAFHPYKLLALKYLLFLYSRNSLIYNLWKWSITYLVF